MRWLLPVLTKDSALFCLYFIYAALNLKPSAAEKQERMQDLEMERMEKIRPDTMTKEEQRAYNRALFLNLPKTPTTPFHKTPMTPRTVAFQKLEGVEKPHVAVSGAGPSRKLPFREHYTEMN